MASVVKYDGAFENYVGRMFLDALNFQWAIPSAQNARSMIVEMATVNTKDGIEKCQWVKLKLRLGASYVNEAEFTDYAIKGIRIAMDKIWMFGTHHRYQRDHDSYTLWIAITSRGR